MCDCDNYSSCSSDEEIAKNEEKAIANKTCKLVSLNFTTYEMCGDIKPLELLLLEFNKSKLSLSKCEINPNKFDVLYDKKKFRLFLKAFPVVVKRSKYFSREKHIKIKDICLSRMLWEVFWNISEKIREAVHGEKKFCWFIEWYRIWLSFCNKRLAPKHVYHFEEASVAIDKVILIDETEYSKEFRLIAEMINAHVLLPGSF